MDNVIHKQEKPLEDSLIKHGFVYDIFLYGFIFGEQYRVIRTYVEQYKGDATHILYTDAWDTLAFGTPSEVLSKFKAMDCKMLISVEKACFPNDERDKYHRIENYPESPTSWKYINGGGCMFEIEYFKELCQLHPFNTNRMMDPDWLAELHQYHPEQIKLDYQCSIFQCISHSNQDEWKIEYKLPNGFPTEQFMTGSNNYEEYKRFRNKQTNTLPVFFHGNGRTNMDWLKETI
jgi:hypothetical protein